MRILYPDAAPAQIEQYIKDYCQNYRLSSDYGEGIPNATAFTVTSSDPSVVEVSTSSKGLILRGSVPIFWLTGTERRYTGVPWD